MNIKSEKTKTRDIKYLAVAQWLRDMPDERDHNVMTDRRNSNAQTEVQTENFTNIEINVEQVSDIDKNHNEVLPCTDSSLNACSVRPLRLHGNKCLLNDPDPKSRSDATGSARRVTFDMKTSNENTDDKADDVEKRVKFYDIVIRTAEEDNAELRRNMTKFILESSRKDRTNTCIADKKPSSKYVVSEKEVPRDTVFQPATPADDRSGRSRKSSCTTREFDDVIFDNRTLRTKTPGQISQRPHSGYQSTRSGWSPGIKRMNRKKPRTVYLKYMTETQEVQTPVIKGLVIDVVDNQKPSVVRASKNANIREEFALRQKVEGYRATCSQSISTINLAQKKLGANLLNMKKKMAARAQADDKVIDAPFSVKTLSEELFLQSKGYFPETRPGSRAYNFPPLTYPKRRLLTIS